MCFHAAIPSSKALRKKFNAMEINYDAPEIFHVSGFQRPFLPVTLAQSPKVINTAQWKLIPNWITSEKDAAQYANTLNAASETIFEKPSFSKYIQHQHGLLYVNGFYEPHQPAYQKETTHYFIQQPQQEIFTLGIVYSHWMDPFSQTSKTTFSIITTPASAFMENIHNVKKRMPLIISPQERQDWLQACKAEEISSFFKPSDVPLVTHQVKRLSTTKNTNTPEQQLPFTPDVQQSLFD